MEPSNAKTMKTPAFDPSRRHFLRQACCAAVGTTGMLSSLAQLRAIGAAAADSSDLRRSSAASADYKALVCVFLQGGNDATNLIIPSDGANYTAYAAARGELAQAQSSLLPIAPKIYRDGRSYGLNRAVPEIQSLFTQGKLAVLANVGTLVQPTTLAQYKTGATLPRQLFSHTDQIMQWQSSVADRAMETGWGGRMADIVNAMNANNQISMSISLNGSNRFELGNTVNQYAIYYGGVGDMTYGGTQPGWNIRARAIQNLMKTPNQNLLTAAFGKATGQASDDAVLLGGVLRGAPELRTSFPTSEFAQRLKMVARMISVADTLGLKRQIFFVQLIGWDLHGGQVDGHGPLLTDLSRALKAFYDATTELGVANQVTTFTASDFGRTYIPNAGGTDHGWGNHQFIMGGAVKGGEIYGQMPSLVVNGPDDTGRGRWIPSTSVDEYNATLATWFGVSASNLSTVLPNIGRFAKPNVGFLG
jgi:uncharacterized protein (DUF1501 family)